ncbi:MAG: SDR family NAD(P)-dependent oxidoreductase, partial [Christensenella sp.]|nr:SDR family NAD(P)-dependent oxidoreductase [Christensenella sp.]MEA4870644.1 SDR family NAD(P)-dependent oxidoreductase [Christensenella sp.]
MIDLTKWEQKAAREVHSRARIAGRLGGKIAVVTGSAQGFGKGIAEELYREGASVVVADLNEPLAKSVAESLGERAV